MKHAHETEESKKASKITTASHKESASDSFEHGLKYQVVYSHIHNARTAKSRITSNTNPSSFFGNQLYVIYQPELENVES